ncbi:hypothetical protein, partial [Streptomyces clavuligerus]|uniref:hypothetical protein n=1 Tax=Streptomyces clavuligerus TaxID=1901 RepID=UPI001E3A7703
VRPDGRSSAVTRTGPAALAHPEAETESRIRGFRTGTGTGTGTGLGRPLTPPEPSDGHQRREQRGERQEL